MRPMANGEATPQTVRIGEIFLLADRTQSLRCGEVYLDRSEHGIEHRRCPGCGGCYTRVPGDFAGANPPAGHSAYDVCGICFWRLAVPCGCACGCTAPRLPDRHRCLGCVIGCRSQGTEYEHVLVGRAGVRVDWERYEQQARGQDEQESERRREEAEEREAERRALEESQWRPDWRCWPEMPASAVAPDQRRLDVSIRRPAPVAEEWMRAAAADKNGLIHEAECGCLLIHDAGVRFWDRCEIHGVTRQSRLVQVGRPVSGNQGGRLRCASPDAAGRCADSQPAPCRFRPHGRVRFGDPGGEIVAHSDPSVTGGEVRELFGGETFEATGDGVRVEPESLRIQVAGTDGFAFGSGWTSSPTTQ